MTTADRRDNATRRQTDSLSLDDVNNQLADACGVDREQFGNVLAETGFDIVAQWRRARENTQSDKHRNEVYTDAVVMALLSAQQKEAWTLLENEYAEQIKWIAAKVLGQHQSPHVDDLWQDVLVKLYNDTGFFDPKKGSFRAYLSTMIRNSAVDVLRSQLRRKRETEIDLWDVAVDRSDITSIYAQTGADQQSDLTKDLLNAIASLPVAQRRIAKHDLNTDRRMTDREIADELNTSPKAVSAGRSKAMRAIRRELVQRGYYSAIAPVLERVRDLEEKFAVKGRLTSAESQLRSALKTLIELYDAACAGYLNRGDEDIKFEMFFDSEAKRVCESNSSICDDVVKKPHNSPYKSLWRVYDQRK